VATTIRGLPRRALRPRRDKLQPEVHRLTLALALHIGPFANLNPSPQLQGLTMSTPAFQTLSLETLATATGGVTTSTTSDSDLRHTLRPILSSLKDLSASSQNNQSQQSSTLMFGMMAAMLARR
jgi:hypothetical protein